MVMTETFKAKHEVFYIHRMCTQVGQLFKRKQQHVGLEICATGKPGI
jgi:hypothetical protein